MKIIKTAILSFIFIFLSHNLYLFFKNNLTVPKVKDLVTTNDEKYSDMFNVINTQHEPVTPIVSESDNMKNELKDYIKNISLKNSAPSDTTPIV